MNLTCVNKIRDKYNNIISYELKYTNGNTFIIHSEELKDKMKKLEIFVDNLKLTSDNRLIDKQINLKYEIIDDVLVKQIYAFSQQSYSCTLSFRCKTNIQQFISRCNLMNVEISYRYLNPHVCVIQKEYDIIVLTDLEKFKVLDGKKLFSNVIYDKLILDGVDTAELKNANSMFSNSKIEHIDLSRLDLSSLEVADHMFWNVDSIYINFSGCNLNSLKSAIHMFHGHIRDIDFTNCKMNNLEKANAMFYFVLGRIFGLETLGMKKLQDAKLMFAFSRLDIIDLSKWENPEPINMESMFFDIKGVVKLIDISSFKLSKVETLSETFSRCQIVNLKLPKFETDSLLDTSRMFYLTITKEIDMSYGRFNKVIKAKEMFHQCCARIININHMKMNKYLYNEAMFLGSGALVICKDNNISRYLPQNKRNKQKYNK